MDQIREFLEHVFGIEAEAILLRRFPDIEAFNDKFEELMTYSNDKAISFEMSSLDKPLSDFKYKAMQRTPLPIPRHIFKISKYGHDEYGELFACYVSVRSPKPEILTYGQCYWVARIEDRLKFVAQFAFGDPDLIKSHWKFTGGAINVKFESIGKPVEIMRIQAPKDDSDSMEDYEKEK